MFPLSHQESKLYPDAWEAIYFITELALAANPADFEALYGTSIPEPSPPGAPFRTTAIAKQRNKETRVGFHMF